MPFTGRLGTTDSSLGDIQLAEVPVSGPSTGDASFSFFAVGDGSAITASAGSSTVSFSAAAGVVAWGQGDASFAFASTAGGIAAFVSDGAASVSFTAAAAGVGLAKGSGAATLTVSAAAVGMGVSAGDGLATFRFVAIGINEVGNGSADFNFRANAFAIRPRICEYVSARVEEQELVLSGTDHCK